MYTMDWWPDTDKSHHNMMTSSNGNIFRVTGLLCGEFTGRRWIPCKGQWGGALMFSLICTLNKWLSKQWWGWWFETPSGPLWCPCNDIFFSRTLTLTIIHPWIQALECLSWVHPLACILPHQCFVVCNIILNHVIYKIWLQRNWIASSCKISPGISSINPNLFPSFYTVLPFWNIILNKFANIVEPGKAVLCNMLTMIGTPSWYCLQHTVFIRGCEYIFPRMESANNMNVKHFSRDGVL